MIKAAADQGARDAALQLQRSFIVQAPAGSGKTELLTQRYLKLLGTVERPERVLAITFTRKATQEMRNRIMLRLRQAERSAQVAAHEQTAVELAQGVLKQNAAQGWELLNNPGRLRILTIDALCTQLLLRDPHHGAVVSRLRIMEDARPLYRRAIRRMLEDLGAPFGPEPDDSNDLHERLVRVLVHLDGDTLRLEELLTHMLGIRDQWTASLGQAPHSFAHILRQRQQAEWRAFESVLGKQHLDHALQMVARLGVQMDDAHPENAQPENARHGAVQIAKGIQTTPPLQQAYWLAQLLTTNAGLPRGPGGITLNKLFPGLPESAKPQVAELKELYAGWHADEPAREMIARIAACAPLDDQLFQDGLLSDVLALLQFLLAELNLVITSEGQTDFQYLAERALDSLHAHQPEGESYSDVLLSEDRRLEHLLLDEFQDTSHTQHRLVKQLISGWTPGDGRTLFLVGDPMQSIYRFRAADVGLFTRVVQQGRMGDVPVELLSLSANFRSRQEVVDWINLQFPAVFPPRDQGDSGAVRYHAATAARGTGGSVQVHTLTPAETDEDEARMLTGVIRQYLHQAEPPDIAVLVRARSHLEALAQELLSAGIAFDAVKVDALASRPVIQDLLSITRALMHPADRVAAAALLRAPWCGLTLPELHRVLGDNRDSDAWQRIRQASRDDQLPEATRQRAGQLNEVIGTARGMLPSVRIRDCVEYAWRQLGGLYAYADVAELENADSFLRLLDRLEREGQGELLERMNEALEALYAEGKPARISLMTIHQAKGLEFDVVILPGLHRSSGTSDAPLVMAQQFSLDDTLASEDEGGTGNESGLLMAPVTQRGHDGPSVYAYLKAVDRERQKFEATRLLYVATTRARQHLHVCGRFNYSKTSGCTLPKGSFMDMLSGAFEPAVAARNYQPEVVDETATEAEPPVLPLLRLRSHPPENLQAPAAEQRDPIPLPHLPDRDATALGQALHLWFELLHDHWEQDWTPEWFERHQPMLHSLLRRCGATEIRISELLPHLTALIATALQSETGRAAISPTGMAQSHAELTLFRREGNRIKQNIIDRVYQTADGRWVIVDYKTGEPTETAKEQWRKQLSGYAELLRAITGAKSVRLQVFHASSQTQHDLEERRAASL